MERLRLLAVAAFVVSSLPAEAQIYSISQHLPVAQRYIYGDTDPIARLTELQKSGAWDDLQEYGLQLLADLSKDTAIAAQLGAVDRNYFYLVWLSTNSEGKDIVNRVLVHQGLTAQRSAKLPGLRSRHPEQPAAGTPEVREVLLSPATQATLESVWVFTPTASPLAAQLPEVVSRVNVLAMVGRSLGVEDEAPSLLVYVTRPVILEPRAAIKIKDTVTILQSVGSLQARAKRSLEAVTFRQARGSACALALAQEMKAGVDGVAKTGVCDKTGDACAKALKENFDGALKRVVLANDKACAAAGGAGDPVVATEQEFLKLLAGAAPKVVTGESTVTNAPLTRMSFGVMTGLLLGHTTRDAPRVKVEGGKIVEAPMERALSMVILNFHPAAYDSDWPRVSWAERFRVFGGVVLTPDVGLTAGAGLGIVRGLSVNTGGVWLLSETPKDGETLGAAPVDKKDPFRLRGGRGGFIGLSYAFK